MNIKYISLNEFDGRWFFEDPAVAVPQEDRDLIKPLTKDSSSRIWSDFVSDTNIHPMTLAPDEWPRRSDTWSQTGDWRDLWHSDSSSIPPLLASEIKWPDDTTIFFAWYHECIVETTWGMFKKHWKCFLFDDEGPLLFSANKPEAVRFCPNGTFNIGKRS